MIGGGSSIPPPFGAGAFATKGDLALLRTDLEVLEGRIEVKLAKMEASIMKWMFGAIAFQTFAILGGLYWLIR